MSFEVLNAFLDYRSNLVTFLRRDENGSIFKQQLVAPWISYHKNKVDGGAYKKNIKYQYQDKHGYWRCDWRDSASRMAYCKAIGEEALEADVNPIRRILSDCEEVIIQRPRLGYYDIETDDEIGFQQAVAGGARIFCLTLRLEDGTRFSYLLNEDTDADEKRMLDEFIRDVELYVDCLVGWNSSKFDDPIVIERSRMLGCNTKVFTRMLFLDHMLTFKKHNLNSAASGEEKQSLALNSVAITLGESITERDIEKNPRLKEIKDILIKGKKDLQGKGIRELWETLRNILLEYNQNDVELMPAIEEVNGYIALQYSVCQATRQFLSTASLFASRFVDSFMLALGSEVGHHFPSKWYEEDMEYEKFRGAFVLQPTELGIHRDVHVFDFSALYPSCFKTFNLSVETKIGKSDNPQPGWIKSPGTDIYFDGSKKGIWSLFFERAQKLRKHWQEEEEKAEPESEWERYCQRQSMGFKVVINSGYGIATSPTGRYYDPEVGESCTQNGAWFTKSIMKYLEDRGLKVLAGDTDAQQFKGCSIEDAKKIVEELNEKEIPGWVASFGCKENHIKLEFEKTFDFVVYSSDGKGESVAKKYIGQYSMFRGKPVINGKPKIKGLEYLRGDSIKLARSLQYRICKMLCEHIFDSMPYEKLILEERHKIMNDYLDPVDVVQSKAISKPLKDYKTNGPHVRLGKILEENGEELDVGTRVRYYVKDASVSPVEASLIKDYCNDADRYYLWQRCFEPSLRLLAGAFPHLPWDRFRAKRPKIKPLKGQLSLL